MIESLLGAIVATEITKSAGTIASAAIAGFETYANSKREMKEIDLRMKRMDMIMNSNPENYVQMRTEPQEFINQDFREAVRNLAGMGFYDINIKQVLVKKGMFQSDQTGRVTGVTINGARNFDSLSVFPKDSHVIVDTIVHKKDEHLFMPELINIRKGSVMKQRPTLHCAYCGVGVSSGQKYCIKCGAPL